MNDDRLIMFFFFSSRRRHTRFDCDWSSDVCSSDLALALADRWILTRAYATIVAATEQLETFRLDEAAKACFEFAWKDLADWYVEAVKPRLAAGEAPGAPAGRALCLDTGAPPLPPGR